MDKSKNINSRYNKAFRLCEKLLKEKLNNRGSDIKPDVSLVQSVLSYPLLVKLIQTKNFDIDIYKPIILKAIEQTRKELFPDSAKKRFISIDAIIDRVSETSDEKFFKKSVNVDITDLVKMTDELYAFPDSVLKKIRLFRQLYPSGQITDTSNVTGSDNLSNSLIIDIYKNVLLGIEKHFPKHFLKHNAKTRCRVLIRFLGEEILKIPAKQLNQQLSIDVLSEYKLGNISRYFNYSVSGILRNAYPDLFPIWLNGHIPDGHWDIRENRTQAVKWLVEKKANIDVYSGHKINIGEKDFLNNGLSYLYKQFYNSVSKALDETYDHLKPWQMNAMPASYWTDETIAEAMRWIFGKLNFSLKDLPVKYANGELNRKTFSIYGLSGLYERKFGCNIFRAVNCAFPGTFEPWEFQPVSDKFWQHPVNVIKISRWLKRQNPDDAENHFSKYKFYKSYRRVFKNAAKFWQRVETIQFEHQKARYLKSKWTLQLKNEKRNLQPAQMLLNGFYFFLVKNVHSRYVNSLERRVKRMERNLDLGILP